MTRTFTSAALASGLLLSACGDTAPQVEQRAPMSVTVEQPYTVAHRNLKRSMQRCMAGRGYGSWLSYGTVQITGDLYQDERFGEIHWGSPDSFAEGAVAYITVMPISPTRSVVQARWASNAFGLAGDGSNMMAKLQRWATAQPSTCRGS